MDFAFTDTGAQVANVPPGGTATYAFSISPNFVSYAGPVVFTVSGLPAGAVATFTPSTIAANSGSQTVTLTIKVPAAVAHNSQPSSPFERSAPVLALLFLPLVFSRKARRRLHGAVLPLLLVIGGLAAASAITGCGTGSNGFLLQPPQTYNVVVTATAGSVVHTQSVTLNVQ